MKKVSVIIPIYNVEAYLRECVDSVLSQTYHNLEIILVDDGSPDRCGLICDDYAMADDRVFVIHKTNGGLSDARNAGMKIATGEYVYFLDSDDYILPDAMEKLVQRAEETDADIVFFDAKNFTDYGFTPSFSESLVHRYSYAPEKGASTLIKLFEQKDYNCAVWTHFYSAEFLKSNEFTFVKGLLFEDLMFNGTVVVQAERICGLNEVLYMRRLRSGSILTSSGSVKKVRSYRYIVSQFLKMYRNCNEEAVFQKKALAYLTGHAANMCLIRYAEVPSAEEPDALREVAAVKNMIQGYDYFGNQKIKMKLKFLYAFREYRRTKDKLIQLANSYQSKKQRYGGQ